MRGAVSVAVVLAALALGAPAASADDGDPLVNACLTRVAVTGCTANVPSSTLGIESSPDGRHVYVGTIGFDPVGVLLYDRASDGSLTMRARPAGCVSASGNQCIQADDLEQVWDLAIDKEGRNVYAASAGTGSLIVFDRDRTTGVLTRKAGLAGCFGPGSTTCTARRGNTGAVSVAVSPNGESVYLRTEDGLAAFDRDTTTGELTQLPNAAGCLTEEQVTGCANGVGLAGDGWSISISAESKHLYVPFTEPGGISVFERTSDGSLTQDVGTLGGCISDNGQSGNDPAIECLDGPDPLLGTFVTGIDPTGATVYSGGAFGVLAYTRNAGTGALTQTGCIHRDATPPSGCTTGRGVEGVFSIAVTPAGDEVVTYAITSGALAFFRRDAATGALTQRTGAAGCVNVSGSGCRILAGMGGLGQMTLAPNGLDVYLAGNTNGVVGDVQRDFAPTCDAKFVAVPIDTRTDIPLACTDANADPVTLERVAQPAAGTLTDIDQSQRSVFYSPLPGFTGQDSFTYRGTARGVASSPATVTLNVVPPQVAVTDADRDGFSPPQDCKDDNPRIRPNAREVRGNGVDENCDDRLGLGRIRSVVRSDWSSDVAFTDVLGLRAAGTPAGSRGQIRCRGKACKFKRRAVNRRRGALDFMKALPRAQRRFLVGQTIEVRITRRFYIGKVVRYAIKSRAVPDGKTLCLPAGSNRPRKRCQPFL